MKPALPCILTINDGSTGKRIVTETEQIVNNALAGRSNVNWRRCRTSTAIYNINRAL
jgi:hypothetical protein